jgi:hypothetical protein
VAHYLIRLAVTAVLVVLIAELAKRSTAAGALFASIPVVSVLAMIWLYWDTHDAARVAALSRSVFWLVLPSLVLFLLLPVLLQRGYGFYASLSASLVATAISYGGMIGLARLLGIRL